jgi:hypothetical protein
MAKWDAKDWRLFIGLSIVYTLLFVIAIFFIKQVAAMTGNAEAVNEQMRPRQLIGVFFSFYIVFLVLMLGRNFFGSIVHNIFYPSEEYNEPQPVYSVVEAKEVQHDYVGAAEGWLKIIATHPGHLKAYLRLMDLYALHFGDYLNVEAVYRLGMTNLRDKQERRRLEAAYQLIQQRKEEI